MELFNVIDKKQTGAFVGAIFIEQLGNQASYLSKNPSQTGHPDLVPKKFIKKKRKNGIRNSGINFRMGEWK